MKIFKELNPEGKCAICGTNKIDQCILVGVDGTEDGNNMQAVQVHLDCIDLRISLKGDLAVLYQFFSKENMSEI